jgi:hypothetical protein
MALVVACVPASADAASHDWQRVDRLKAGQSITIQTVDSNTLSGVFVSVDNASVTVRAHDADRQIARDTVAEIRAEMTSRKKGGVLATILGFALYLPNGLQSGSLALLGIGMPLMIAGAVMLHRAEPSGVIYRRVPPKPAK